MALYLAGIDLAGTQLIGAIIEQLASAPSSPSEGRIYYDTSLHALRVYTNSGWLSLGSGGGGVTDHGDLTGLDDDDHTQYLNTTRGDARYYTETEMDSFLSAKAPLASPTFTGTPVAPTATAGTNTTQVATTAFVTTAVSNLVDAAPGTLDTLNELAAALGDDANFASTISGQIGALDTRLDAIEAVTPNITHKYAASIGNGSSTSITVTHNLGTRDIQVQLFQSGSPYAQVYADVEATSTTTATIRFAVAPTTNQYRVVIVG